MKVVPVTDTARPSRCAIVPADWFSISFSMLLITSCLPPGGGFRRVYLRQVMDPTWSGASCHTFRPLRLRSSSTLLKAQSLSPL